jgi:hypothetical protein
MPATKPGEGVIAIAEHALSGNYRQIPILLNKKER